MSAHAVANPRLFPVLVETTFDKDDVLFCMIDRWISPTQAYAVVRDVPLFSDSLSYGDRILVSGTPDDARNLRYERTLESSRWSVCALEVPTETSWNKLNERLLTYADADLIAGKYIASAEGIFGSIAVPPSLVKRLTADLELFVQHGIVKDFAWSVER